MTNEEVVDILDLQAKLMELHGENSFKSRAFSGAAYRLDKLRYDFTGRTQKDIESIEGIGKSISKFICELLEHGSAKEQDELINKTPPGVIDMMGIKGLGPKKVHAIWKELDIESVGELLYACNENRLSTLKGFGQKTQEAVKASIEFKMANSSKKHYASVEPFITTLVENITKAAPKIKVSVVGDFRRKAEVLDKIEILSDPALNLDLKKLEEKVGMPFVHHKFLANEFVKKQFELTATKEHLQKVDFDSLPQAEYKTEEEIYTALKLQYIEPELREGLNEVEFAKENKIPKLIELSDLKGILHNHSTYSDGVHSLKEMADYCKELGYQYLGICDHSKSAFYAQGLNEERVWQQQMEIAKLNKGYGDSFKILSGIESDILNDGNLDYAEDVLKTFDFIVASVHSNLKMTEEKATERLIKAIENPYTSILGHPTGRLLLARPGYPINHKKVIDACAANKVSMELNAHPYRLDIDWRWIWYCLEKNVMVSINPDAHHMEGYHDMKYGVCVARKGMLTKEMCLNALDLADLQIKFKK
ncbi:MAG: PHP domain-containing protein [Sphingobacteriaceae bacterium]|nr:PHP domain-containing protein [Sphingobacteriaceae bacterium]